MGSGNSGQMTCFVSYYLLLLLFSIFVVNSLAIEYFNIYINVLECIHILCTTVRLIIDEIVFFSFLFFVVVVVVDEKFTCYRNAFDDNTPCSIHIYIVYCYFIVSGKYRVGIRPSFSVPFESHSSLSYFIWVVNYYYCWNAVFAFIFLLSLPFLSMTLIRRFDSVSVWFFLLLFHFFFQNCAHSTQHFCC